MLTTKSKGLLLYIVSHCERIEKKIKNQTYKNFLEDEDFQEVLCFNILQIGELANKFDNEFLKSHDEVPWIEMKAMRNKIVHGYGTIDKNVVWLTAIKDIGELRKYCEKTLKENK